MRYLFCLMVGLTLCMGCGDKEQPTGPITLTSQEIREEIAAKKVAENAEAPASQPTTQATSMPTSEPETTEAPDDTTTTTLDAQPALKPGQAMTTLSVEGMTCEGCESLIWQTMMLNEGIASVKSKHETGESTIIYDAEKWTPETLASILNKQTQFTVSVPE